MRGIFRNLTENGCGLIEVPNFDMMLENSLYSEFIQDHLSYFTVDTFERLLSGCGFDIVLMEPIWNGYILSAQIKKRTPINVQKFRDRQDYALRQMKDFLENEIKAGRRVAVWGAGHQALANLSLLEMKSKIICVVDSAEFKQNKFTPATHIPIVAPSGLLEYKIDTVIIMAAGYSDEVAQIMALSYPQIKRVIFGEDCRIKEL